MVDGLGLTAEIDYSEKGTRMLTVEGSFQLSGSVELFWKLRNGNKTFRKKFFVVDNSPYPIVFGWEYMRDLKLVTFNWGAIAVVVKHSSLGQSHLSYDCTLHDVIMLNHNSGNPAADGEAANRQIKDKAALEERKQQKKKKREVEAKVTSEGKGAVGAQKK